MYKRIQLERIIRYLKPNFVVVLYGARRTGKTVLMQNVMEQLGSDKILYVTGDNLEVAEIIASRKLSLLQRFVAGYDYLFIDEAQTIPGVGASLKLMIDNISGLHVFITGSSALDLQYRTGEPLTGRSIFLRLLPMAQSELGQDMLQMIQTLEEKLIYGNYPQVMMTDKIREKVEVLQSLKNGYLLKDVLVLDNLKDSIFVLDLLRLIAFQIGKDISYSELASHLRVNTRTVQRYLHILEKTFVIFSHRGFSRNLRKEISKSPRYYFWDNGIRNTVISNYNELKNREDSGALWENFCISERLKYQHYSELNVNNYFWRTYDQQEIDLVEEYDGRLHAFEFKWMPRSSGIPKAFKEAYPDSDFRVIHRENYYDFFGL
jgi:predicted AAA+ superfamily ATPase